MTTQKTIRYDEEDKIFRVNEHKNGDMNQLDESENLPELKKTYPDAEVLDPEW